jgi:hypothetical protein
MKKEFIYTDNIIENTYNEHQKRDASQNDTRQKNSCVSYSRNTYIVTE